MYVTSPIKLCPPPPALAATPLRLWNSLMFWHTFIRAVGAAADTEFVPNIWDEKLRSFHRTRHQFYYSKDDKNGSAFLPFWQIFCMDFMDL